MLVGCVRGRIGAVRADAVAMAISERRAEIWASLAATKSGLASLVSQVITNSLVPL